MYAHIERIYNTVGRNLGLKDYSQYVDSWVEWAFEAELLIGSRDTFEEREYTYSSTGASSTGTITFTANPSHGDFIVLNGVTIYFWKQVSAIPNPSAQYPNQGVECGVDLATTLTSLKDKLDKNTASALLGSQSIIGLFAESLEGYTYSVDTTTLTITKDEVGIDGNNYTLSSSDVNAKCSGSHLTGGKGLLNNQQLRLPDNMVKLLGVRVGADSSKDKHRELRKPTAVHKQRVGKNWNESQQRAFRYYIQGNRLNIQHDQIDEITIVCSTYPVDARGYPMIRESHATAVAQYIMWQHKNIDYINGRLSMYVVKDLEKRWYFLCGKARGDDNMPTAEELKQIGKIWNTMVPLKSNTGLIDL
tara:strand:+ start:967 stop:2049 length:1083 start_codon:yes stop_codon:yes gene_type:complete